MGHHLIVLHVPKTNIGRHTLKHLIWRNKIYCVQVHYNMGKFSLFFCWEFANLANKGAGSRNIARKLQKNSPNYPVYYWLYRIVLLVTIFPEHTKLPFLHYKHHVTYKGLIGIAPSGAITLIGQLYSGSSSDKEIVNRCVILRKELWDDNDSVMADRWFTIDDKLKPLNVQLSIQY